MINMLDALGAEFLLFLWTFVGAIVGLAVELGTGNARKSSVLFQEKLAKGSLGIRIAVTLVNVMAGTLFAYVGTSLVLYKVDVPADKHYGVFFLVGIAGLSLLRAYSEAKSNRKRMVEFLFKILDLFRGGGK